MSFARGQKLDVKNHNWLIFKEYLALGFCYMSFVIKDRIENDENYLNENVFDPESYNYVFNKSSSFLDGDFVAKNHVELKEVLDNFRKVNPSLLVILRYFRPLQYRNEKETTETSRIAKTVKIF